MAGIIDRISVAGRVVMITGAGQGIGRTYALEFARAGALVGVAELNEANARRVAAEIAAEGGRALAVNTDVGSPESVRAAVTKIEAELGPHGVTVNCVLPGLTETEVDNPGRSDTMRKKVIDLQCVKLLEVPEYLVGTLLFPASPGSDFITGQSLVVDGGCVFL